MEHVNHIKAVLSSVIAVLTALWGWFGWLVVLFFCSMAADYLTGSAAAIRNGKWSSKDARDGIWHKAGSILVVLVAGAADLLIGTMLGHLPGITLPWEYTVLICPIVVVWYILTELGSILENAAALGAPAPKWLAAALDRTKDAVDAAGEQAAEGKTDEDHRN